MAASGPPRGNHKRAIAQQEFQADYEKAVKLGNAPRGMGCVVKYYGSVDRYGGVTLVVEFDSGAKLAPYFEQSPEQGEVDDIENDAREWADNMSGATEWFNWQWEKA